MTYSEPLLKQFDYFFLSLGFGMMLDVWYIIVMLIRMCISEKKQIIIAFDILFSLTVSIASFFFMVLCNNGQVRLNLISGQLAGAAAMHFILGGRVLKLMKSSTEKLRGLFEFLLVPLKSFFMIFILGFRKIKKLFCEFKEKNNSKNKKTSKNFNIITKMHLKNKNKSV